MVIKNKLYPYPVLSPYSDDYKCGSFDVEVGIVRDGYNLTINFCASLTSEGLLELIKTGRAKYVFHLECAQTGFRVAIQTNKISEEYPVLSKNINGKLQICSFVVASSDIKNYSNLDFHDDYNGLHFDVEEGCVLAVSKMVVVNISKEIDEPSNTSSIFNVIMNTDRNCNEMLVDMAGRKILVMLPLNDYYCYKQLQKTPQAQPILNAMTIIPALVYVLEELKLYSSQDWEYLEDILWFRVLKKTFRKQFDIDMESEDFRNQNVVELAQKLVNSPLSDAFKMLATGFDTAGGDVE